MAIHSVDEIRDSFAFFDDWEDRYKFIIDLGRGLAPMADALKVDANIVRGCQSQVWIDYRLDDGRLYFTLDSDAMIVRGLIAIVLAAFNGRTPDAILAYDIDALFNELDLMRHLSPTRGNGLTALVRRIRDIAASASLPHNA
ncbi:MAG TPA: SufE family protein [Pseudomonadales bacterium]